MDKVIPEALIPVIDGLIKQVYSYGPLAEQTVVLVPGFVDAQVDALSEAIGFDKETLSYTLGLFACYPLGLIMLMLPYGKLRHLFSFFLGAFLLQFTIGKQWIHHAITCLVAYVMLLILPPSVSKTVIPIFTMVYCTLGHLHRQYINYLGWDLDFTGCQMVLTMKLYSLSYNIYDGHLIATGKADRAAKKCADVSVVRVPGIAEYLGYTFNFSTILAGPAFEYKFYADACDGTNLLGGTKKPSNLMATLRPLAISLFCMVAFVVGNGMFPLLDSTDPQNNTPVILTEEFLSQPWLYRTAYIWICIFFVRNKYYFGWKNAEGACNIWYMGFEGYDENGKEKGWEISNNMDILAFETASSIKNNFAAWNKKTSNWLGRYVYSRTGGSLTATYSMSAFWHGFYPGYYLAFLSVPFATICERLGRKKLTPHFDGIVWKFICWLSVCFIRGYMSVPFILLALDWCIAYFKSNHYCGHICLVVFYIVVSNIPSPKDKSN